MGKIEPLGWDIASVLHTYVYSILFSDLSTDLLIDARSARHQGTEAMLKERQTNRFCDFSVRVAWKEVRDTADWDIVEATKDTILEFTRHL